MNFIEKSHTILTKFRFGILFLFLSNSITTNYISAQHIGKNSNLFISSGETFNIPSGSTVTAVSGDFIISSGATVNLDGKIKLNGGYNDTFLNSGTLNASNGTLLLAGCEQTIFPNTTVKDVELTGCQTILASPLSVLNHFSVVGNGRLNLASGLLTFKSTANGTASVTSTGSTWGAYNYIDGNVNVERYFPARRAFRLVSQSVTINFPYSIYKMWQENGSWPGFTGFQSGVGTPITGGTSSDGFDQNATGNPSMFTFNNASGTNTDGTWSPFTNATNSTYFTAGRPFRLLVRGDRTLVDDILTTNTPTPTNTVLRSFGKLAMFDVIDSSLSKIANGFSLIGNPYQAPVNMKSLLDSATNVSNSYFYIWDPTLSTRGAYVTVNLSTGGNSAGSNQGLYLQAGMAAFVKTASNGTATIRWKESHKNAAQSAGNVFLTLPPQSTLNLKLYQRDSFKNNAPVLDALEINFDPALSNNFEDTDAKKPINQDENLSVFVDNFYCSVESRNIPNDAEIIDLRVSQFRDKKYTLIANFAGDLGKQSYLLDRHTESLHPLNSDGETIIDFDVDPTNPESTDNQRFAIVFNNQINLVNKLIDQHFTISPNPVNDDIVAVNSFNQNIEEITLLDLTGKMISKLSLENNLTKIPSNVPNGIYLISIRTPKGIFTKNLQILR